ncbi:MAG TPA: Ig-like domain-containing protein [Bdellovibrionota bacterium]|nr:Ig-like domain-containing protein [Bdellovibrionota bacterium]
MKRGPNLLLAVLVLVVGTSCSKESPSDVTIGYSASELSASSGSAILGVIAPAADGSVEILYASPFLPPDQIQLSNLSIPRVDAEVVILTFSEALAGVQPTFLPPSAQKSGNLVHLPPNGIFHAAVQGARSFVPLADSDPKATLIQAFADMVCVDSSVLVEVTPTPSPSPTPTSTPTPTPTPTPNPDQTPPTVVSISPPDGAFGIAPATAITVTFSEPIDPASVTTSSFSLSESGQSVPGTVQYNTGGATFTPARRLALLSRVTVSLGSSIRDLAGNGLTPLSSDFTTRDGTFLPSEVLESDPNYSVGSGTTASDAVGNLLVIWPQSDGTRSNLYSRYRRVGQPWDPEELVETLDTQSPLGPQAAFWPSGEALVVWNQSNGSRNHVYANRFDPTQPVGQRWGVQALVEDTPGAGATFLPRLRIDSNGNATAAWTQTDPGSTVRSVWANRYDAASKTWGSQAVQIENEATSAYLLAILSMDADQNGNTYASWIHTDAGGKNSVFVARYLAASGWVLGAPIESLDTAMASPQVVVDPVTQDAIVVWNETDLSTTPSMKRLRANHFSGGQWGSVPDIVDEELNNQVLSSVQLGADSFGISALWVHNTFDSATSATTANLYLRRYTSTLGWSPVDVIASLAGATFGAQQIALDRQGNAMAFWERLVNSSYELVTRRYVTGFGWLGEQTLSTSSSSEVPRFGMSPLGHGGLCWIKPDPSILGLFCSRFE